MIAIHFFENKTLVFSKLAQSIPTVDEQIKIKGRKCKVLSIKEIEDNVTHVHVCFEPVIKIKPNLKELNKRRR
ncbi:hypothetical protein [Bacillus massiliigorillae]|uniref:hypothetical protein n=1 Tax=Bacillus massiliigorillae TaxID=1243664 RepID=UPI00039A9492|nr:hypothetical protein [Bacillus massiliigorillae]